ncbi:MAG: biotin-dependent carboxyltransferase family protein [Pseudomonadota bacterium]
MATARLKVLKVGPLVTFQDLGRPGYMKFGVPGSGPMDRVSFCAANLALGNEMDSTSIEVSMGGIEIECIEGALSLAVSGNGFIGSLGDHEFETGCVFELHSGQRLSLRPGASGCWCYLAFAGKPDVPTWLGKTATHSQSGFGGGRVKTGQILKIENTETRRDREGRLHPFDFKPFDGYARIVLGPQERHFTKLARSLLLQSEFQLSTMYDRMGYRLEGPKLEIKGSLSIPSEPITKGSIQVSGNGTPTILLADHQTTGGYPKIATVVSADLDTLAQLRPHEKLRFKEIDPQDATKMARIRAIELSAYFNALARSRSNPT